jgi:glycosyltransferase involved in cell wall biosynthesis
VQEKRKGHDEVLDVLPELVEDRPDLAYLVCGDGDDRPRLEAKARRLGLSGRVVFAGYVPETEKVDHSGHPSCCDGA